MQVWALTQLIVGASLDTTKQLRQTYGERFFVFERTENFLENSHATESKTTTITIE
jgi:hypothetical protein